MAAAKKPVKKTTGTLEMNWTKFFIALSIAANIGFVVVVTTMMTSHALDGMFMREGLNRYCASQNNEKFTDSSEKTKALREYTCASGDAKKYFEEGFNKYLDVKGVTSES
jgi:hypothetical protein